MEHMANNSPRQGEGNVAGYVIGLLMLAAVVYVLLT